MTPYERGYAAGLRAAAEVCRLHASDAWDHEGGSLWCAEAILSLPIVGDATNPGEQVPDSARIGGSHITSSPDSPGPSQECEMVPREPTEKMIEAVRKVVDEIPPYIGLTGNALNEQIWKAISAMLAAANEEHDAHR